MMPYIKKSTTIIQDHKRITFVVVSVVVVTPPCGVAVSLILHLGDPFPVVADLVSNFFDHSDNSSGAGVSTTFQSAPDSNVLG
ncbi:hypothetical protein DK320_15160, partial [Listeria monocytogenes]